MGFRRDGLEARAWETRLREHRGELIACGVPRVLQDKRSWYYFLEHGYFTPPVIAQPILNVEGMERGQAERVCLFLEQSGSDAAFVVLNRLQWLLKRGRHAERSD